MLTKIYEWFGGLYREGWIKALFSWFRDNLAARSPGRWAWALLVTAAFLMLAGIAVDQWLYWSRPENRDRALARLLWMRRAWRDCWRWIGVKPGLSVSETDAGKELGGDLPETETGAPPKTPQASLPAPRERQDLRTCENADPVPEPMPKRTSLPRRSSASRLWASSPKQNDEEEAPRR